MRVLPAVLLCIAVAASALAAESSTAFPQNPEEGQPRQSAVPPFPGLYFMERLEALDSLSRGSPYSAETEDEVAGALRRVDNFRPLFLNDDVLAFYGHPLSKRMGILGVYPLEELDRRLTELAAAYDVQNGTRGVKKAFYIIYGTVWPEGEIGYLRESVLKEYIEYAAAHDILVFVDHQIGRYGVAESLKRILPFLRYPNVHLALDPEWRTTKPMVEIGSVSAAEINAAQEIMERYIIDHDIPGERLLVIHQFNWKMIQERERVRSDFGRVRLVHCADGFGAPAVKRASYAFNARATNIPVKGFKLFIKSGVPGTGFDEPLLKPSDVLQLEPRPYLIMYQ